MRRPRPLGFAIDECARVVRREEPLVRVDDVRVDVLDASEPLPNARREERGGAVGAVDVQPAAPARDTRRRCPRDRRSSRRSSSQRSRPPRTDRPESARSSAAASAGPVRRPRSSWGDREQVDVHHARRRRHRGVHGVRARDLPTRRAITACRSSVAAWRAATRADRLPASRPRRSSRRTPRASPRVGEPTEHLVLRPHGAPALEPAPPVDLGRAHREVEEHARLARCARHEREEARVVGRDGCRCEHVPPRSAALPRRRSPRA